MRHRWNGGEFKCVCLKWRFALNYYLYAVPFGCWTSRYDAIVLGSIHPNHRYLITWANKPTSRCYIWISEHTHKRTNKYKFLLCSRSNFAMTSNQSTANQINRKYIWPSSQTGDYSLRFHYDWWRNWPLLYQTRIAHIDNPQSYIWISGARSGISYATRFRKWCSTASALDAH